MLIYDAVSWINKLVPSGRICQFSSPHPTVSVAVKLIKIYLSMGDSVFVRHLWVCINERCIECLKL